MCHGTPILNVEKVPTLEECMDQCASYPSCNSVDFDEQKAICYLSNDDSPPTLQASRFASAHSVGCSGACEGCKDDCDTVKPKPDPKQCNDKVVDVAGFPFRVSCDHCYSYDPAQSPGRPQAKSHEECMQLFTLEPSGKYEGAHWHTTSGCVLKPKGATFGPDKVCVAAFTPLW